MMYFYCDLWFYVSLFQDRLSEFESVHIFLGNQAMDLDSTVASLVYAFYSYQVCRRSLLLFNPSNAEATFVKSTGMQRFVKTI